MTKPLNAEFVTVWDGGELIATSCHYDADANTVEDIGQVDADVENLEDTYIELPNGDTIRTFHDLDADVDYENGQAQYAS